MNGEGGRGRITCKITHTVRGGDIITWSPSGTNVPINSFIIIDFPVRCCSLILIGQRTNVW